MLKLASWNVNGLRAILKKGNLLDFIATENPDIICLQEIKMRPGQAELDLPDYEEYWNSAERPGYSGTAVFSKIPALRQLNHCFKIQDDYGDLGSEGRVLALEFEQFFLVNVYTPNSKHDLTRLALREKSWDPAFLDFLKNLEQEKPVITCGDFNAAHTAIDLARPKDNEKNAGYTPEERQGITNLISAGFIDTFRHFHPDEIKYSWWSMRQRARERNIGWRIDYFFASSSLEKNLISADIHDQILGSDHCPISLEVDL